MATVYLETLEITEDKRECTGAIHICAPYPDYCGPTAGTTITAYSESTNEPMKEPMKNQKPNNPSLTQRKPDNPC